MIARCIIPEYRYSILLRACMDKKANLAFSVLSVRNREIEYMLAGLLEEELIG
jgi:hypothetical protein